MRTLVLLLAFWVILLAGAGAGIWYALRAPDAGAPAQTAQTLAAQKAAAQLPPPPAIEPVQYLEVSRDTARAMNAAVPFSKEPNPAAAPLRLSLPALDDARAVDCLAAAAWYEAGDNAAGEQAVVQVVLNRMRHRAFPKTICGVVFQGSERATGCQFSFTCDGSLARTPSQAAWQRARNAAMAGMHGLVFAPVGYATHYHTDWVVPNWSASVDKIAAVQTHLFFRWRGANGKAGAFQGGHQGEEPIIAKLARLSPAHLPVDPAAPAATAEPAILVPDLGTPPPAPAIPAAALRGNELKQADAASNLYVIQIADGAYSGTLALTGLNVCKASGGKACTVVGFLGATGRVLRDGRGRMTWPDRRPDFYYYSDPARSRESVYWNCKTFERPNSAQCMPEDFAPAG